MPRRTAAAAPSYYAGRHKHEIRLIANIDCITTGVCLLSRSDIARIFDIIFAKESSIIGDVMLGMSRREGYGDMARMPSLPSPSSALPRII